jgi:hypothetical protein
VIKTLHKPFPTGGKLVFMYRKVSSPATEPEEFELPFQGELAADNRWVIMALLNTLGRI